MHQPSHRPERSYTRKHLFLFGDNFVLDITILHISVIGFLLLGYQYGKPSRGLRLICYWVASMAIPVGKWVGFVRFIFFPCR